MNEEKQSETRPEAAVPKEPCYFAHLLSGYVKPPRIREGIKVDPFKGKTTTDVARLIQANIDEIVAAETAGIEASHRSVVEQMAKDTMVLNDKLATAEKEFDECRKAAHDFASAQFKDDPRIVSLEAETAGLRALIVKKDACLRALNELAVTNITRAREHEVPLDTHGDLLASALALTPSDLSDCVVVKRSEWEWVTRRKSE